MNSATRSWRWIRRKKEWIAFCLTAQARRSATRLPLNFLETLGIEDYDVCFITIGDNFQDSLETTSLVKELGGKLVVARASNDVHAKFLLRNGADQIFYPEKQVADWAAIKCSSEHILGLYGSWRRFCAL